MFRSVVYFYPIQYMVKNHYHDAITLALLTSDGPYIRGNAISNSHTYAMGVF